MISKELLEILVCPENRTSLNLADGPLVARLNRAIESSELRNRAGAHLERPIDGGLIREDGRVLYPIVDGIPILLVDEGVPLDQLAKG